MPVDESSGLGHLEFETAMIEARTAELVAEATGEPVTPAVQVPTPDELRKAGELAA